MTSVRSSFSDPLAFVLITYQSAKRITPQKWRQRMLDVFVIVTER